MTQELPPADDSAEQLPAEDYTLALPDDLPPVEPPSAGMIIQLFLVPAVIVLVILGVYTAFGKLASQELDWRQLVTDVRSENPHVRWRGALSLAQMLDADAQRGEQSQNLAANPEIAKALADLYSNYINLQDLSEEELKNLEFLSKALGRMRAQDEILPVLRKGIAEGKDRDVRKHSLIGLSMLAGNVQQAGGSLDQPELVAELIAISKESDKLFRHQGAYALGLFPSAEATARLVQLLRDPDLMTRLNAAIGLTRQGSEDGIPVLLQLVEQGTDWQLDPTAVKTQEQESEYFERMLMLLNSLKALSDLQNQLTAEQNVELSRQLESLAQGTRDMVLKSQALELKQALSR